ncbi:MAG: hypothetical protein ABSA72_12740, partial [Nitrososphaerales archaeon]
TPKELRARARAMQEGNSQKAPAFPNLDEHARPSRPEVPAASSGRVRRRRSAVSPGRPLEGRTRPDKQQQ